METLTLEKPTIEKIRATSKIRKLITQLPIICGCESDIDPLYAERLSVMFGAAYDVALENGTALDCTTADVEMPGSRLAIVNPGNYNPRYEGKAWIGFSRLVIAEYHCYLQKGRITQDQMQNVIDRFGNQAEMQEPEIDAIITYEQVIKLGYWWM